MALRVWAFVGRWYTRGLGFGKIGRFLKSPKRAWFLTLLERFLNLLNQNFGVWPIFFFFQIWGVPTKFFPGEGLFSLCGKRVLGLKPIEKFWLSRGFPISGKIFPGGFGRDLFYRYKHPSFSGNGNNDFFFAGLTGGVSAVTQTFPTQHFWSLLSPPERSFKETFPPGHKNAPLPPNTKTIHLSLRTENLFSPFSPL